MARLVVTATARQDLLELIRSHALPADTRRRVRRSIAPLSEFPLMGAPLERGLAGLRFILGPWRWMVIVYRFDEEVDAVHVLAIVDARSSTSPTRG